MAEREIFSVCGKTVYMRRTKNGETVGTPRAKPAIMTLSLMKPCPAPSFRAEREIFFVCGKADSVRKAKNGKPSIRKPGKPLRHTNHNDTPHLLKAISKNIKKQLTQERQCGKIIPVADEAAPFERAMKKISKNHLTNLFECGKIIKSLEERWFFEN